MANGTKVTGFAKYKLMMLKWLKTTARKIAAYLANPDTWKSPKTWIGIAIFLRLLYVFMNEYGLNPFKKNVEGDHVFLTGAGGGIGRLMALELGKLGCSLSLSDINKEAVVETKSYCVERGIPANKIITFKCDMSNLESIKQGAETARSAFGDVHILINNAGIVSGK